LSFYFYPELFFSQKPLNFKPNATSAPNFLFKKNFPTFCPVPNGSPIMRGCAQESNFHLDNEAISTFGDQNSWPKRTGKFGHRKKVENSWPSHCPDALRVFIIY